MNTKTGAILAAVAVTGALTGCTASAGPAGPETSSVATAAASASAGAELAGQLAAASQLCADVLQNGFPGIGVDQAGKRYDQWAAEAGKAGRQPLAAALSQVGADAAVTYADETHGRNPEDALDAYEHAADAVGARCLDGAG